MSTRPEILFPLFADLETLEGVGPKIAKTLEAMDVHVPRDLLLSLPHSGINRRKRESVQGADLPGVVTVEITVGRHQAPSRKGGPYRVHVEDAKVAFQLVFFNARSDYLTRILPTGARRVVSGRAELFDGVAQIVHPDHILPVEEADDIPDYEPVYHLTAGITQKVMTKATRSALARAPKLPEWIDAAQKAREGWPDWHAAIEAAHHPKTDTDLSPAHPARVRLAYDEFMAHQLTLALARAKMRRGKGRVTQGTGALQAKVRAVLPYTPTGAQSRA
ncbi:MAG: ATP-dependent DNA helicase RecG, partial [Pseudomonadota bacterium]